MSEIDEQQIQLIEKHFNYIRFIARGSFGDILHVQDKTSKQDLALKLIRKQENTRKLMHEANILKSLAHKNVVKYKGVIETQDFLLLSMEFVGGGSLQNLIDDRFATGRGFTDDEAATLMRNLFEAICYLHSQEVAHCDLKPENILIQDVENLATLKVADLGLATKIDYFQSALITTQKGTVICMAPE